MTAREPCGRVDPALGHLPGAVAHARFHGDAWLSTADRCITIALEAAAPNTRIAWICDSGHSLRVGAAQDLAAAGVSTVGDSPGRGLEGYADDPAVSAQATGGRGRNGAVLWRRVVSVTDAGFFPWFLPRFLGDKIEERRVGKEC